MTAPFFFCIINIVLGVKKVKKLYRLLALNKLHKKRFKIFLLAGVTFSWLALSISSYSYLSKKNTKGVVLGAMAHAESVMTTRLISPVAEITPSPTGTPSPTPSPSATPTPIPTATPRTLPKNTPTPNAINPSQYTAEKINDVTWRVKNVANDDKMASAQEVFNALNYYRNSHGVSSLLWDNNLSSFAQSRANLFSKNGSLDSHSGFTDYMNNDGFNKSGFNGLGENSAFLSGNMSGERIVKDIFGADGAHDGQQLNPLWTHAGVGVSGVAVNVNFGKNKK